MNNHVESVRLDAAVRGNKVSRAEYVFRVV